MDKRFQVFVSSTYLDLKEERQAVIEALLELDCIPAGVELFPASNETRWELIRSVIDDCDYYIVIIGGKYGLVDSETGISYTEREYDYAVSCGIPVLGFVHDKPELIAAGKSEKNETALKKFEQFRSKVKSRMCKSYLTPDELGAVVSRSLVKEVKRNPREGWVRARFASSAEEINSLRGHIDVLQRKLDEARISAPPESAGLAKGAETFGLDIFSIVGDGLEAWR